MIETIAFRWVESDAQLLYGGDNHLVGIIGAFEATNQCGSVGILFDTTFLKLVELVASLFVKVFAVDHKHTFFYIFVIFEQSRSFETGERFATTCSVPNEAVAIVLRHTVDDALYGIDLVWAHDENFFLGFDQHHVATDESAQRAFRQHHIGELEELHHFAIVVVSCVIYRQIVVGSIEMEMLVVVVGKIHSVATAIAHDEELHEAHERVGVAIATILLVAHDLLYSFERRHAVAFQLDLHQRKTIDEDNHIVALTAIGSVDCELAHHLIFVFAPVAQIDKAIVERSAIVAHKGLFFA